MLQAVWDLRLQCCVCHRYLGCWAYKWAACLCWRCSVWCTAFPWLAMLGAWLNADFDDEALVQPNEWKIFIYLYSI